MIILYGTGPMFGLPHASPFAIKAEVLIKMAGLPYTIRRANLRKAPKGKIPWIDDGGTVIPDSTFIRLHLEKQHGADFSGGYDPRALSYGLALERLMEDHLYWLDMQNRWLVEENFRKGPVRFFDAAPALIRPLVVRMVVNKVCQNCRAHGIGRHSDEERGVLGRMDVDAVANALGSNDFILGEKISGADATMYGFLLSASCPLFASALGEHIRSKANLVDYLARMTARFFPDLA